MVTLNEIDTTLKAVSSSLIASFGAVGNTLSERVDSVEKKLGSELSQLIKTVDATYHRAITLQTQYTERQLDKLKREVDSVHGSVKSIPAARALIDSPLPKAQFNLFYAVLLVVAAAFILVRLFK